MANKLLAIKSLLKDNAKFSVFWNEDTNTINSIKYYGGQTPLTDEQIAAEEIRLTEKEAADKIIYDSEEWKRKRQWEYPKIEELVVALYDSEDKSAIDEKRAAVKLKYPKPVA
jgi:hypothetical protein